MIKFIEEMLARSDVYFVTMVQVSTLLDCTVFFPIPDLMMYPKIKELVSINIINLQIKLEISCTINSYFIIDRNKSDLR